mmetsp:Transcript_18126/g.46432  ORF Transcript_18126/g.46432 Transcript_18126/m.46432 type:complete len:229 (-) Transcript_18126:213-899(-)
MSGSESGSSTRSSTPFLTMGSISRATSSTIWCTLAGCLWSVSLFSAMDALSRMLLIRFWKRRPVSMTLLRHCWHRSLMLFSVSSRTSMRPRMPLSGVRSSWVITAKKRSLCFSCSRSWSTIVTLICCTRAVLRSSAVHRIPCLMLLARTHLALISAAPISSSADRLLMAPQRCRISMTGKAHHIITDTIRSRRTEFWALGSPSHSARMELWMDHLWKRPGMKSAHDSK